MNTVRLARLAPPKQPRSALLCLQNLLTEEVSVHLHSTVEFTVTEHSPFLLERLKENFSESCEQAHTDDGSHVAMAEQGSPKDVKMTSNRLPFEAKMTLKGSFGDVFWTFCLGKSLASLA